MGRSDRPNTTHPAPGTASGTDTDSYERLRSAPEDSLDREARQGRIMEMLFDGALIMINGEIVEVNSGLLSMTGYSARELLGRPVVELGGWEKFADALVNVQEGFSSFESSLPRKTLPPVAATVRTSRENFDDGSLVIAVIAGVTENEPASVTLLRAAERYRSLFESVSDHIFTKDPDLRFSEVNPAMAKTLGLPQSVIVGKTADEIFGPEAGARIRAWDLRVLAGETVEEEHALVINGAKLTFHDIRVPIRNSAGEIVGLCGVSRDVTERRETGPPPADSTAGRLSKAMAGVMALARQAASSDSIVLLQGESGAGKDHLAAWIHEHSKRSGSPFLTINCATVPHELAEAELFGHEQGAFTGASRRKRGLLELAEGGTLLLNEVGELPPPLQSKLLVFLDSRSFRRLGGERDVQVDARIIAATHKDLGAEVASGRFSKALFYRLEVFPIKIPPLRERLEDIPGLARELIAKLAKEMNVPAAPSLDSEALRSLFKHDWPGNVRELRNVLERALIQWRGGKLRLTVSAIGEAQDEGDALAAPFPPVKSFRRLMKEAAHAVCLEAIQRHGGNRSAAAHALGLSRESLYRHLRFSASDSGGIAEAGAKPRRGGD